MRRLGEGAAGENARGDVQREVQKRVLRARDGELPLELWGQVLEASEVDLQLLKTDLLEDAKSVVDVAKELLQLLGVKSGLDAVDANNMSMNVRCVRCNSFADREAVGFVVYVVQDLNELVTQNQGQELLNEICGVRVAAIKSQDTLPEALTKTGKPDARKEVHNVASNEPGQHVEVHRAVHETAKNLLAVEDHGGETRRDGGENQREKDRGVVERR